MTSSGSVYNFSIFDLAAGSYNYYYWANDTSGNANNTNQTIILTYTINKANSEVNLTLDGTDGNISINTGDTVNETGFSIIGEGLIQLYENNSLVNNGTSPIGNITTYNNEGTFNVTVRHIETENFTQSEETHFITVSIPPDLINPTLENLTETPSDPATYSSGARYEFNATILDNVALNLLY